MQKTLAIAVCAVFFLVGFQARADLFPEGGHYAHAPQNQVRGFYSNGSLSQSEILADSGLGFLKLHRWRDRGHGSLDMIEILERAAMEMDRLFPGSERLQVGDLSAERGGKISGHASHQNGLDADLGFLRVNQLEQDPDKTDGFPESFVKNGKISPNFDTERNWAMIKVFVSSQRVGRIFVDQVIKDHLCAYAKKIGESAAHEDALRRLRPYPNHDNHLHLRITCPKNSSGCVEQAPPPPGSGC